MSLPAAQPIVITGVGLVTGLGLDRHATFAAMADGRCALGPMPALEQRPAEDKGGGQALDLLTTYHPHLPRAARYVRFAAERALRDARTPGAYAPERCSAVFGTTLHGMRAAGRFLRDNDPHHLRNFLAGAVLRDALAGLGLLGGHFTTCAACASGLSAVGLAVSLLRAGEFDLVVAGGYDTVSEYVYAGFDSLRLVATGPVRPFGVGREGMKVAEGFGVLVLEREPDAARRGARPLALVAGVGESSDAHHLTQPHPAGDGAARAATAALSAAGLAPGNIGLIAAHATATPNNDAAEHAALATVFGPALPTVPVVPFKAHLGHTLGGAGAVELILAATAMERSTIPPTPNITRADVEFPALDVARPAAVPRAIPSTLNLSLGFGGSNACVILASPDRPHPAPAVPAAPSQRDAVITGVGVILPGAVGNETFAERFRAAGERDFHDAGPIPDDQFTNLLNARRIRRMSDYVKLTLAATAAACADAAIADLPSFAAGCSAILGTTHGSTGYCEQYYHQIVTEGIGAANPMLFAEGVPNAAAAQLSLMLGVKGGCQTIIGARTAGLDALRLAALRIRLGLWERAIVSAAEEHSELVERAYASCEPNPGNPPPRTASAAITFILESREAAAARNARIRGLVESGASAVATTTSPDSITAAAERASRAAWRGGPVLSAAAGPTLGPCEQSALRRAGIAAHTLPSSPRTFSAGPLALLAGGLLTNGLPGGAATGRIAALATDPGGPAACIGVRIGAGEPARES